MPSTILLLTAALAFLNARRVSTASFWVAHTWEVKATLHQLVATVETAVAAQRGYVLTKQDRYIAAQAATRKEADRGLKTIASLTRDNAVQQQNIQGLTTLVHDRLDFADRSINLARQGNDALASKEIATGRGEDLSEETRSLLAKMDGEEDRLLALRRRSERRQTRQSSVVLSVLLGLNFLIIVSVVWLLRRVQSLERLVTICAWSRLIRHGDDWISIEEYLEREYGVSVTHGMSETELAKVQATLSDPARAARE